MLLGDRVVAPDYRDEVTKEYAIMRQDINWDGGMRVGVTCQNILDGHVIYKKHLVGTVNTSGLVRQWVEEYAGGVNIEATVGRVINKSLVATMNVSGAAGRSTAKGLASDVNAGGTVDRLKVFHKALATSINVSGDVSDRAMTKGILGVVNADGSTNIHIDDFLAASGSGYGRVDNDLYAVGAWSAANADSMQTNVSYGTVGQMKGDGSPRYTVMRMYPIFDLSAIPAGSTILQAELFFAPSSNSVEKSTDMVLQNGQPTYPHNPAVIGDYDKSNYSGDGGSIELQGKSYQTYYSFLLNATGEGWMQVNGITKLCLRSEHDIAGSVPSEEPDERCRIYMCDGTYPMYLRITWTE